MIAALRDRAGSLGEVPLQRDELGPLVAALDGLLARSPATDALQDVEHFL